MSNIFGGLGGALGGLVSTLAKSGLAPQDDPSVKYINAQTELKDLQNQEDELLLEIGRHAYSQNPSAWPSSSKIELLRNNIATATQKLQQMEAELNADKQAQEAERLAQEAADAIGRCPSCGEKNAEGVKFCQSCGTRLVAFACSSCGAELAPGARFCGVCGSKQGE